MNTQPQKASSPRAAVQAKYTTARLNLLLMIILTVVNIVILCFKNYTMMLFSATIPYYLTLFAQASGSTEVFIIALCLSAVILLCYLLCWILSKKHFGWMIAALVMFVLDFFAMIGLYFMMGDISGILDMLMHAYVIFYLVVGVLNGMKLKKMPKEEPAPEIFESTAEEIKDEE